MFYDVTCFDGWAIVGLATLTSSAFSLAFYCWTPNLASYMTVCSLGVTLIGEPFYVPVICCWGLLPITEPVIVTLSWLTVRTTITSLSWSHSPCPHVSAWSSLFSSEIKLPMPALAAVVKVTLERMRTQLLCVWFIDYWDARFSGD